MRLVLHSSTFVVLEKQVTLSFKPVHTRSQVEAEQQSTSRVKLHSVVRYEGRAGLLNTGHQIDHVGIVREANSSKVRWIVRQVLLVVLERIWHSAQTRAEMRELLRRETKHKALLAKDAAKHRKKVKLALEKLHTQQKRKQQSCKSILAPITKQAEKEKPPQNLREKSNSITSGTFAGDLIYNLPAINVVVSYSWDHQHGVEELCRKMDNQGYHFPTQPQLTQNPW